MQRRTGEGLVAAKFKGKQIGQVKAVKLKAKKREEAKDIINKYSKAIMDSIKAHSVCCEPFFLFVFFRFMRKKAVIYSK